jgi:predicted LPLAT superfamily acyltransferase
MEVSRALARRNADVKLTVLVHTRHAQRFNRLLAVLNHESQADVIQVADITAATAVELSERVARGEFVVIAADRVPVSAAPRVVTVPFLGDEAPFPVGPYVLAGLLNCRVYLLFCLRAGDGYHLFIEPFAETVRLPRVGRDAALRPIVARFAARLEHYCRMAPLQWCNFYPFWPVRGSPDPPEASPT